MSDDGASSSSLSDDDETHSNCDEVDNKINELWDWCTRLVWFMIMLGGMISLVLIQLILHYYYVAISQVSLGISNCIQ